MTTGQRKNRGGSQSPRPCHICFRSKLSNFHSVAFRRLDFRKNYAQDAVFQFGFDVFDIDVDLQSDRAHELAVAEFMAIERIFPLFFLKLPLSPNRQAVA